MTIIRILLYPWPVHSLAWELVKTFLQARFSGVERHQRRLAKVVALEHKEAIS